MSDTTAEYKLGLIRARHERRIAGGQVGGVQEWFEIASLLRYIDDMQTEWEYSIKRTSPDGGYTEVFKDWMPLKNTTDELDWYQNRSSLASQGYTYAMVRRLKAGKPEDVTNE